MSHELTQLGPCIVLQTTTFELSYDIECEVVQIIENRWFLALRIILCFLLAEFKCMN